MLDTGAAMDVLPVAMLAGVFGLDVVSFPQAMISRPIVAATVGGAFFGAPVAGLACGAALECLALESLPVGASRYPEWGSASIVAGAIAAHGATSTSMPLPAAFVVSVMVGIAAAWLGGWSMVRHRQFIASVARPRLERIAAGNRRTVVGLQLFGMTADLVRGSLIGITAYLPARLLVQLCAERWQVSEELSRAVVVTCVAAVAATAVWKDFHAISLTRRIFLASLAVGTLLVVLRG
jgi:PTS system mannose-specific IIC component